LLTVVQQADVIGTAASVVAFIGTAFTLIQQVQSAREKVKGASKSLDNVSKQLEGLVGSLNLVKEEERLQTAAVRQQVTAIIGVEEELRSFFDRLAAEQQRKAISQFFHALKSSDKDDKELEGILKRLDRSRDELVLRISVAQVGLVGNLKDGFRVAFDVLMETNKKVNEVLGTNLVLVNRLKDRSSQTGT
jgi:ABC-type transporter Mla subunit MlaD